MKSEVSMDVIDSVSRLMTLAFKFGLFIGGSSLLFYCYRLQFFPAGLSVGDGFLMLILAVSFGFIYILFVASLVSLSLWMTPAFRAIQWIILRCAGMIRGNSRLPKPVEFVSPDFAAFTLGLFGIGFIYSISKVAETRVRVHFRWMMLAESRLCPLFLTPVFFFLKAHVA